MRERTYLRVLVAATVGVYALVIAGATLAIGDAAAACRTWPVCDGPLFGFADALRDPALAVVLAHRTLAAVTGVLVLAVPLLAYRRAEPRRVQAAFAVAALLYPVQIGLGAVTATAPGAPAVVSSAHLLVGTAIFGALVGGLAWSLEAATAHLPSRESGDAQDADAHADSGPGSEPTPDPDSGSGPAPAARGPLATARAYFRLTKPRLMWLLCLVASAAMALAAGPALAVRTVLLTLTGGVLAIGASGTFNHVLERDVDREMSRTADRPLATDRIPKRNALAFGGLLTVASVAIFLQVNALAAALGLTAILFYAVVYTLLLKPNTVQNTVIGGAAGALPALIGWAAVTDSVELAGLALAGVIFLWTPAHFYNLALAYREDYERGGFPMLPVVRGAAVTRKHILLYLGATLVGATALAAITRLGPLYAATSVALGAVFLWAVVRLHRERTRRAAFRAFHASNAYLGCLLVAVVVDALAV